MIDYSLAQPDCSLDQYIFQRLIDKPSTSCVERPTMDQNLALGPVDIFSPQSHQFALQAAREREKTETITIICSVSTLKARFSLASALLI
jgi:hypothetical protein